MATNLVGSVLHSRYRVDRLLKEGGMATIFVVYDSHLNLNSLVAKELDPAKFPPANQQDYIELFGREANLLAPLRHVNIPRVSDFFEEDGKFYLVMDLVQGEDMEIHLAQTGQLTVAECLEIGITVCKVLEYLHSQNPPILHRDIKPPNLIRQPDGSVIVIDFGIAKAIPPHMLGKTAKFTQMLLGSPGYASPEQYYGRTDQRSDLYSLGVTLHQLLSNQDPAQSQTPFQFPDLETLRSDVTSALAQLVEHMVQLTPANRPGSAIEVRLRLEGIRSGNPIFSSAQLAQAAKPAMSVTSAPVTTIQSPKGGTVNSYPLTVYYSKTIEQMVAAGRYDCKNTDITSRNYPHNKTGVETPIIEVVHFNKSLDSDAVVAELDKMGLRPATAAELLALGEQLPYLQRQWWIVGLGSVAIVDGDRCVPCLGTDGFLRRLDLFRWDFRWDAIYRFAAVRK